MNITILMLLLAVSLGASPITASAPIPINGTGTFGNDNTDPMDRYWTASITGSNGVDSMWASLSYFFGTPFTPTTTSMSTTRTYGSAGVNGSGGPFLQFYLGPLGTGVVNVYDWSNNLLASADLIGYLKITSFDPGDPKGQTRGTFVISPTHMPEPATWMLMLCGLVAISAASLRRRALPR